MNSEEWKESGSSLGHAFIGLGKTMVRSAERVVEIVDEDGKKDENGDPVKTERETNSTVFSDGTWKTTFGDLGRAFVDVGNATMNTINEVVKEGS